MEGGHLNFSVSSLLDEAQGWEAQSAPEEAFASQKASKDSFSGSPLHQSPLDLNQNHISFPRVSGYENCLQGSQNCSYLEAPTKLQQRACKTDTELPLIQASETPRHSALTLNELVETSRTPVCGVSGCGTHKLSAEQWSAPRVSPPMPPPPPPPAPSIMVSNWAHAAPLMEMLASGMLPLLLLQGFPDFAATVAALGQQGFAPSSIPTTAAAGPGLRRAVFSDTQRQELERAFRQHAYITKLERKTLAERLGLRDAQVKIWFQNRRMKWRNFRQSKPVGGGAELHSPPQRTTAEAPGCQAATSPCLGNNGSPSHINPSIPSNGDHLKREVPEENGDSTPGSVFERPLAGAKVDSSLPEANRFLSAWNPASSSGPDPNHFHLAKEQLCTRALWG